MKVLLLVAAEPRHQYTANVLGSALEVHGIVHQRRAPRAPPPPCTTAERARYAQFSADQAAEEARRLPAAGSLQVPAGAEVLTVEEDIANDLAFERFVRAVGPQIMVALGCSHVGMRLRRRVTHSLAMHLGFTPRYRGADGLFWPLYNLDPERLGVSIVAIDDDIDGGPIAHHSRPELAADDSLHAAACKAIVAGAADLQRIVRRLVEAAPLMVAPARSAGRVYFEAALHPRHLQVAQYVMERGVIADYLAQKEVRDAQVTRVCYPGLD